MASKASSKLKTNEIIGYIVLIAIIGVVFAAIFYVYKAQRLSTLPSEELQTTQLSPGSNPVPTPTPTPTQLIHGKDTYNISGGMPDDPHFQSVTIDPMDPKVGAQQTFAVQINSKYPVTKAFLAIRTDTKTSQLALTMTSGTATNGTWETKWTMPETYLYNYLITPNAQTAYNEASSTITIRQRK